MDHLQPNVAKAKLWIPSHDHTSFPKPVSCQFFPILAHGSTMCPFDQAPSLEVKLVSSLPINSLIWSISESCWFYLQSTLQFVYVSPSYSTTPAQASISSCQLPVGISCIGLWIPYQQEWWHTHHSVSSTDHNCLDTRLPVHIWDYLKVIKGFNLPSVLSHTCLVKAE